jgi:hypothetical protein
MSARIGASSVSRDVRQCSGASRCGLNNVRNERISDIEKVADSGDGPAIYSKERRKRGDYVVGERGNRVDTTTSAGKLVFGIFASLAEFERDLISERTRAGLASARARGRKGGAPFKMTAPKVRLAMAAMGQKETKVADLCAELGITRQTLYRHVAPDGTPRKDGLKVVEGAKTRNPRGKKQ